MLRRLYVEDQVGESIVLFVDKNRKAVFISDTAFNEKFTLKEALRADYSNFAGCKTAEEANANYADGSHLIVYNEDDWEIIEVF